MPAEAAHPRAPARRERRDDQLAAKRRAPRTFRGTDGRHKPHAGCPIQIREVDERSVDEHRTIRAPLELRQHTLGLAKRIAEQDGRLPHRAHLVPPVAYLSYRCLDGIPAEKWQRERRLGHERMATNRLECGARGIGRALVVSGHDPHLAPMLNPHLRGTKHVTGGMKRDTDAAKIARLTGLERFKKPTGAYAVPKEPIPPSWAQVRRPSRSQGGAMGGGNTPPIPRRPRNDVKTAG